MAFVFVTKGFDFGYGRDENVVFLPQKDHDTVWIDGDFACLSSMPTTAFALILTIYRSVAGKAINQFDLSYAVVKKILSFYPCLVASFLYIHV